MSGKIRIRRGNFENLPDLAVGEFGYALDTKELAVGGLAGNDLIGTGQTGATGPQGATGAAGGGVIQAASYYVPGTYSTIQAAIDQAHNVDGHTSFDTSPAIIHIAPGVYNESLTLRSGVSLTGPGAPWNVKITGNATFAPSIVQSQLANRVTFDNVTFLGKFELSGSNQLSVIARKCIFQTVTSGTPCILMNANLGRADLHSCSVTQIDTTQNAIDIQNGRIVFTNPESFISSSSISSVPLIKISGTNGRLDGYGINIGGGTSNSPNLIELASTQAFVLLRNCVVANSLSGGAVFYYTAAGTVDVSESRISNNNGKLAISSVGGIFRSSNCTFGGINDIDPTLTVQTNGRTSLRHDPWNNKVFVGGNNGFPDFTSAFSYAVDKGIEYLHLVVEPGTYNDDIIIPPEMNVQITGNTGSTQNFAAVFVNGCVIYNPTTHTNFSMEGIRITTDGSRPCLEIVTGTLAVYPSFRKCEFFQTNADNSNNYTFDFAGSQNIVSFYDCDVQHSSPNSIMRLNNWQTVIRGMNIFGQADIQDYGAIVQYPYPEIIGYEGRILLLNDCHLTLDNVRFNNALAGDFFRLMHNTSIVVNNCQLSTAQNVGQMFYCLGDNNHIDLKFSHLGIAGNPFPAEINGPAHSLLARSGWPSKVNISVVNNIFNAGDSITIDGVTLTVNVDFTVGATTADTAFNIAQAINNNNSLFQTVFAMWKDNSNINSSIGVLTVYSYEYKSSSNGITISHVDGGTDNIQLSSSVLSGGLDGGTNNIIAITHCRFDGWATNCQDSFTIHQTMQVPNFI